MWQSSDGSRSQGRCKCKRMLIAALWPCRCASRKGRSRRGHFQPCRRAGHDNDLHNFRDPTKEAPVEEDIFFFSDTCWDAQNLTMAQKILKSPRVTQMSPLQGPMSSQASQVGQHSSQSTPLVAPTTCAKEREMQQRNASTARCCSSMSAPTTTTCVTPERCQASNLTQFYLKNSSRPWWSACIRES